MPMHDGDNVSTQDSMTGTITGSSAFDAAGNLILPMELWDHDDDTDTDRSASYQSRRLLDVHGGQ